MPRPLRGGSGRPQPALFRGELEDRLGTRRLVEQGPAVFERVLLRDRRELVDETLDHEGVVCGPDAAPERSGNSRRLLADILDPHVGKRVGRLGRAVHGIDIEAPHHGDEVVEAGCAYHPERLGKQLTGHPRHDRGGRDTVSPGDRSAVFVQASRDPVIVVRPIHIVLDVLFAGPHHLHRTGDLLCDLHRPDDEVHLKPTAEAAAQEVIMDLDFLRRQAGQPGGRASERKLALGFPPRYHSRLGEHGRCSSPAPWLRVRGMAPRKPPRPSGRRAP